MRARSCIDTQRGDTHTVNAVQAQRAAPEGSHVHDTQHTVAELKRLGDGLQVGVGYQIPATTTLCGTAGEA